VGTGTGRALSIDLHKLPRCPEALRSLLAEHEARVVRLTDHAPRFHVRLESPSGPLFAWYGLHPDDEDALRHELAVRAAVGTTGVLRTPPVLASGPNWRLERMIVADPLEGTDTVDLVVAAWHQLAALDLPARTGSTSGPSPLDTLRRRARLMASPLPNADLLRARRMEEATTLPRVTVHGDFHPAHVLPADGAVWVIDWELSGHGPSGLDLMQLWAGLPDAEARGFLLDAALRAVGPTHRGDLLKLRYVALVRRIASKLAEHRRFGDRDPVAAGALLDLLPEVRTAAVMA
jgi:hypothetical protein